jgi:hypothetical protein
MKFIVRIAGLLVLLSLVGCAGMPGRYDYKVLEQVPVVEPDKMHGVVCFLREDAFTGGGISYFVMEGDQKIGLLRSGSYFMIKADSGQHTYWAETEAKDYVTVDVEAGQCNYVIGGVALGMWAGRPSLEEVTQSAAQRLLPELDYTILTTAEEAKILKQKNRLKN